MLLPNSLWRWPDSRPVLIQMWVHGESGVYCTTDLCLTVNQLKNEKISVYWGQCLHGVLSVNCWHRILFLLTIWVILECGTLPWRENCRRSYQHVFQRISEDATCWRKWRERKYIVVKKRTDCLPHLQALQDQRLTGTCLLCLHHDVRVQNVQALGIPATATMTSWVIHHLGTWCSLSTEVETLVRNCLNGNRRSTIRMNVSERSASLTILCNMIWSLQHHQALSLLARAYGSTAPVVTWHVGSSFLLLKLLPLALSDS